MRHQARYGLLGPGDLYFGLVASLPSPPSNAIHVGGLQLRAYGLAIALGVLTAVWIAQRRWSARGGDPHDISRLAVWSVVAGLVGARLYHVITDHQRFEGRWLHTFAIWEGGLGIPGALIAGVLTGALIALYVAGYALGRLWVEALRIDPASRIAGLRVNIWISILALIASAAWLTATRQRTDGATGAPQSTSTSDRPPDAPSARPEP